MLESASEALTGVRMTFWLSWLFNMEHMLLHCRRWEDLRIRHMGALIREARERLEVVPEGESSCEVEGEIMTLILGGISRGCRLDAWLPDRTRSAKENLQCGLFRVARYLQSIAMDRSVVIREIRIIPRGVHTPRADAVEVGQHRIGVSDPNPAGPVEGRDSAGQTNQLTPENTTMGEEQPLGYTREVWVDLEGNAYGLTS